MTKVMSQLSSFLRNLPALYCDGLMETIIFSIFSSIKINSLIFCKKFYYKKAVLFFQNRVWLALKHVFPVQVTLYTLTAVVRGKRSTSKKDLIAVTVLWLPYLSYLQYLWLTCQPDDRVAAPASTNHPEPLRTQPSGQGQDLQGKTQINNIPRQIEN